MKTKLIYVGTLALCIMALVACAAPTPAPTPTTASNVNAILTATAPQQPSASLPSATLVSSAAACGATYSVPIADFRSDDPKKIDDGNKPKLVEFYTTW